MYHFLKLKGDEVVQVWITPDGKVLLDDKDEYRRSEILRALFEYTVELMECLPGLVLAIGEEKVLS